MGAPGPGRTGAEALMLEIASDRAGARTDAALGVFGKPLHVVAGTRGIAFTHGREAEAYSWDEVRSIEVRRRSVRIAVADRSYVFRLVIDDVVEPTLSAVFANILEELRAQVLTQRHRMARVPERDRTHRGRIRR